MSRDDNRQHIKSVGQSRADDTFMSSVLRVCGPSVAVKLMAKFGGLDTYFPRAPAQHHAVVQLIGLSAAQAIAREVGYGKQWVPQGGNSLAEITRVARRQAVKEKLDAGVSHRDIARKLHMSGRTVERDIQWLRAQERPK